MYWHMQSAMNPSPIVRDLKLDTNWMVAIIKLDFAIIDKMAVSNHFESKESGRMSIKKCSKLRDQDFKKISFFKITLCVYSP